MRRRVPDLGKLLFVLPNLFTMSAVLVARDHHRVGQRDESVFLSASQRVRWFRWNGWKRFLDTDSTISACSSTASRI